LKLKAAYHWGGAAPAAPAAELARLRAADASDSASRSAAPAVAAPSGSGDVVHPQLVTLVHQQLDVLATSAFRWTGEAWPGVPMDWRIHDEDAGRQAAEREAVAAERNWSTRLELQLPVLGTVEVRLTVHGSDVHATVVAPTEGTRTRLAADGGALAARFDAANLRLEQFQVAEGTPS
jgi:flagellar hook-length control protein FliK